MRKPRGRGDGPRSEPGLEAEVAIIGAGPVGLATALALAEAGAGLDVALVGDPGAGTPAAGRAIALSRGSVAMLEVLGVWQDLAARAQPMERVVVTDGTPGGTQLSLLEFACEEGSGPTAYLVEDADLRAALAARTRTVSAIRLLVPRIPTALAARDDAVTCHFGPGMNLRGRIVVGADGGRSAVRSLAGIRTIGWTYRQAGIVAIVEHSKPHHGVAVERFLPAGPFAILPLIGNRSSIVWTEPEDRARALLEDRSLLRAELELRFGTERGTIGDIGPAQAFPLAFHIAREFMAPRVALVGDAAHSVHPLAGQGLNLGLRDAAALAQSVVEAHRLGLDFGAKPVLERYQRWRRFDTVTSALAYDGLNRLFSNDLGGLRALRDLGLGLVDRLPPLKRLFMREAAGQSGEVPRLMTGAAI